jgi:hypothetical protein
MHLLRARDPRLDPALRPDQWAHASRMGRAGRAARAGVVLALLCGVAAYFWFPFDRTREMSPDAVVEAAGLAMLRAGHYRFRLDLTGSSPDYPFPEAALNGEYQQEPRVLRLDGEVLSGEARVPVAYYLQGQDLYLKHPTIGKWVVVHGASGDDLGAFAPENVVAPLLGGVSHVEVAGRERLPGGEALQLRLDLDPQVLLPNAPARQQDHASYRLWVYTRNLRPARLEVDVHTATPPEMRQESIQFSYTLTWDYGRRPRLTVPQAIVQAAADAGAVGTGAGPDTLGIPSGRPAQD